MIFVGGVVGAAVVDLVAFEGGIDAVAAVLAEEAAEALAVLRHLRPYRAETLLAHRLVGRQEAVHQFFRYFFFSFFPAVAIYSFFFFSRKKA